MRNLKELDQLREKHPFWPQTETSGAFKVMVNQRSFLVLASVDNTGEDGMWEHISVTPKNQKRCPTWDEMCAIKKMFFRPEEECVEFHPKESEYVNRSEYCLHIWRPAVGKLNSPYEKFTTIRERDTALERLWGEFSDVPIDPRTDRLEDDWFIFQCGAEKEDIWHWFDRRHSKGVAYLLYGDGIDRTDQVAKLVYLNQFCIECESQTCQYNHGGECRFALVHERKPRITDDDGCIDYDYQEGEA